jgi:FkbM family methyltransferase
MMYLASDRYMGRSLELYGECVEGEIALFTQFLNPGMTVVDVGAHIGTHTVYFAQTVGSTGRVVAAEPQRFIHQILCANIALNGLTNVVAYHAALGDQDGIITVPLLDYAAENNFGGLELGKTVEGEPVAMATLDGLALPQCHFVKIDVEGMEAEVLQGARATLAQHQPLLYVENDRRDKSAALIALLFELGYRLYWDVRPLFNPANFAGVRENVFGSTVAINMLGVPRTSAISLKGFREITSPDAVWRG